MSPSAESQLFDEAQLKSWADEISKFIYVRGSDEQRPTTAEEAEAISNVALLALKVLNSCNNLKDYSQTKEPVLRNAQEKIKRLLPYCRGWKTMYEQLDEMLVHFEIKFRDTDKVKTPDKTRDSTMDRD